MKSTAQIEIEGQVVMARLAGFDIASQNPHEPRSAAWQWFRDGWVETHSDPDAPKKPLR